MDKEPLEKETQTIQKLSNLFARSTTRPVAWQRKHKCRSQTKTQQIPDSSLTKDHTRKLFPLTLTKLINWKAAKLSFKFYLFLSTENNFMTIDFIPKCLPIVLCCVVKFAEIQMATRVACIANVAVGEGERAKSDRVKIGARGGARDEGSLARSSSPRFDEFFCSRPNFRMARIGRALYSHGCVCFAGYSTWK